MPLSNKPIRLISLPSNRILILFGTIYYTCVYLVRMFLYLPVEDTTPSGRKTQTKANNWTAPANAFKISVRKLIDGDSIEVNDGRSTFTVRLAGVDCPENDQPFGSEARSYLKRLLQGKNIYLEVFGEDKFGRTVGVLYSNQININEELLAAGLAWAIPNDFNHARYTFFQNQARSSRQGLWEDVNVLPPWQWRAHQKFSLK